MICDGISLSEEIMRGWDRLREVENHRSRLVMITGEYRVIGRNVVVQGKRVVPLQVVSFSSPRLRYFQTILFISYLLQAREGRGMFIERNITERRRGFSE
jgi:hypothetical protein